MYIYIRRCSYFKEINALKFVFRMIEIYACVIIARDVRCNEACVTSDKRLCLIRTLSGVTGSMNEIYKSR